MNTICDIIDVIEIKKNRYGENGLFCKKRIKKNTFICATKLQIIENSNDIQKYEIKYNNIVYELSNVHSVEIANNKRFLSDFDSFINHSCDPNTYWPSISDDLYVAISLRDISVGEEITTDYSLFDYSCDGHELKKCKCNSKKCRRVIKGFINENIDYQLANLPLVDQNTVWIRYLNNFKFIDLQNDDRYYTKLINKKLYLCCKLLDQNDDVNGQHIVVRTSNIKYYFIYNTEIMNKKQNSPPHHITVGVLTKSKIKTTKKTKNLVNFIASLKTMPDIFFTQNLNKFLNINIHQIVNNNTTVERLQTNNIIA